MFRKIIKKLSNFQFTSILTAIISGVAGLYALGSFFLFHFAGDLFPGNDYLRMVGFYERENGAIMSFIVFAAFFLTLILSIVVVYSSFPFIMNKEKMLPKKSNLMVGFVSGVFEFVLLIMMMILLGDHPKTAVLIGISLPFGILSTIGCLLYIIPFLKCSFFMPPIVVKEKIKFVGLDKLYYRLSLAALVVSLFIIIFTLIKYVLALVIIYLILMLGYAVGLFVLEYRKTKTKK